MMGNKKNQLAKLTRPYFSGIFVRRRLFKQLDRGRKRPLLWISGPPGAGKTILISSYIQARKLACLWYQVDAGDVDAATFFHYLGLAASSRRSTLPALTPEYIPGLATFARRFFEQVFARLKSPGCVVFDNFNEAADAPVFQEVIRAGLEVVPKGINILIISRSEPPASFARFRAREAMELLGAEDLRLNSEE